MKTLIVTLLMALGLTASAQVFQIGLRGGVNVQNVDIKDFQGDQTWQDIQSGSSQVGFHAGLYTRISLLGFHIQPELLYTQINSTIEAQANTGAKTNLDISLSRIDIPILAGVKLGPLRANLGPVVSFNVSEQEDVFMNGLTGGSWGYQAGLGLDLGKIRIDVRYEGPFSKASKSISIGDGTYETDVRNNQLLIGLGYKLF